MRTPGCAPAVDMVARASDELSGVQSLLCRRRHNLYSISTNQPVPGNEPPDAEFPIPLDVVGPSGSPFGFP
jgi:hypothetical protein